MPELLSVVERGWRGARECSLDVARQGIQVTHLIKGRLPPDVRRLIQPVQGIALYDAPRWRFPLLLWTHLVAGALTRRVRWALFDHERTLAAAGRWCRLAGVTAVLIRESGERVELSVQGQPLTLVELVSGRRAS
jgi:hypothetical protein